MPQTATNEDSVQFSLHELRRIEAERQAHERELAEQQRLAAEQAQREAERAARERKESEKRRRLEAQQRRAERLAQYRARVEAEQSIAIEAARVAIDAKRVELEIKRVELEAQQIRAVSKPSVWRRLAVVAMFAIMLGQAVFIGTSQRPQRAATPVAPAEVLTARLSPEPAPIIPADSGDRIAVHTTESTTRTPPTSATSTSSTTSSTTTDPGPERFTLDGCDPDQPLCRN